MPIYPIWALKSGIEYHITHTLTLVVLIEVQLHYVSIFNIRVTNVLYGESCDHNHVAILLLVDMIYMLEWHVNNVNVLVTTRLLLNSTVFECQ